MVSEIVLPEWTIRDFTVEKVSTASVAVSEVSLGMVYPIPCQATLEWKNTLISLKLKFEVV